MPSADLKTDAHESLGLEIFEEAEAARFIFYLCPPWCLSVYSPTQFQNRSFRPTIASGNQLLYRSSTVA